MKTRPPNMPMKMAMSVRPATLSGLRVYACSARRCSTQYWFQKCVGCDLQRAQLFQDY